MAAAAASKTWPPRELMQPSEELLLACIIFSTVTDCSLAAYKAIILSLMVSQLNIRKVRGGGVLGPMGREFMKWRDWVGRVGGWW